MTTPTPSSVRPENSSSVQFPDDWDDSNDCPALLPSTNRPDSKELSLESKTESTSAAVNGDAGNDMVKIDELTTLRNGALQSSLNCDDESESDDDEDDVEEVGQGEGHCPDSWKKEDGATISCECFICNYCTTGYEAADKMKAHIESEHSLSFEKLKTVFNLKYEQFVQFVRWARDMKRQGVIETRIQNIWSVRPEEAPWQLDKYILPPEESQETDYFLTLDYFAFDNGPEASDGSAFPPVTELITQIERLKLDQERMVKVVQRVIADSKSSKMGNTCAKEYHLNDDPDLEEGRQSEVNLPTTRARVHVAVTKKPKHKSKYDIYKDLQKYRFDPLISGTSIGKCSTNDDMYFDSYNEVGIHEEMIFDIARTDAYKAAISERRECIENRLVLDVGCGSGILSMFCAELNPKMVYAVDKSEIIYDAMSNGFENNFDAKIKYLRKDLDTDDTLEEDVSSVDVIVSEFMGYFLFFEGMTETFIRARQKFLKPGGLLLPDKCSVYLVPLGTTGIYQKKVACWDNAYGYKMPALQARVLRDTHIETVEPSEIIGAAVEVKTLDLYTCCVEDVFIDQDFTIGFEQDGELCAVAGYFSVDFTGTNNTVILSTSPWDPPTHWKQAVFFLPKRFKVNAGETMDGHISSYPHHENPRWLIVHISLGGITQRYEFH